MSRRALILLAALALPAHAGMFDDDVARQRIDKLRTEVDDLTGRIEQTTRNQLDFSNQAEALRSDVARLRGQIEVLLNDMEATQKRQQDFYIDLDNRLRKLEGAGTTADTKAPEADPAKEARDYEAALNAFKGGKYREAIASFQSFIQGHPNSELLPNAHFWTASSHFQMKEYQKAADIFAKVAATWPQSQKAPDALLAQGNALGEYGDAKGSKKVLEALVAQYPGSTAAQTAKQRLKR